MKLGTLLLRDAVLSLNQLELGLRTQVLYGGKLGTNLVELGFIDLDTLARYLADLCGLPGVTQDVFDNAPEDVVVRFTSERAQRYSAFPLGYLADSPGALSVAFVDPPGEEVLDRLAKDWGEPIAPRIAPELRVFYYHERRYGIARKARYVRQGSRRRADTGGDERRRTQPAGGIELPPAVTLEPRRRPSGERERGAGTGAGDGGDSAMAAAVRTVTGGDESSRTVADAVITAAERAAGAPAEPPLGFDRACDLLDSAEHRDQIGDTVIRFAEGRFEVAVVFLLRDANALGWRLYTALGHPTEHAIQELSLPLGGASALQAAHDSGRPLRGGPMSAGRPIEKRLWDALGTPAPRELVVVPIKVRQRVVNLVYVHGPGGDVLRGPHAGYADEIERLAERASQAYTRLIQNAKRSVRSPRAP